MGFDCSGLAQAAWAAAGVAIPRTTYEDWAELPHIPMSSVEPGDLLLFNGEGHVGIYVGNGYLIDAPVPGQDVERVPLRAGTRRPSTARCVRSHVSAVARHRRPGSSQPRTLEGPCTLVRCRAR